MSNGTLELGDHERLVRGLYDNEYDHENKRVSAAVFRGPETSVNRLAIYNWGRIWYFLRKNEKPPSRVLFKGLEISVEKIKDIGRNFTTPGKGGTGKPDPRQIHVIPDRFTYPDGEVNESHALIMEQLPKTMAVEQIPPACQWHDPPTATPAT